MQLGLTGYTNHIQLWLQRAADGKVVELSNSLSLTLDGGLLRCNYNGKYFVYTDFNLDLSHVSCTVEGNILLGTLYR